MRPHGAAYVAEVFDTLRGDALGILAALLGERAELLKHERIELLLHVVEVAERMLAARRREDEIVRLALWQMFERPEFLHRQIGQRHYVIRVSLHLRTGNLEPA